MPLALINNICHSKKIIKKTINCLNEIMAKKPERQKCICQYIFKTFLNWQRRMLALSSMNITSYDWSYIQFYPLIIYISYITYTYTSCIAYTIYNMLILQNTQYKFFAFLCNVKNFETDRCTEPVHWTVKSLELYSP